MEWDRMVTVALLLATSAAGLGTSSPTYLLTAPRELHPGVPTTLSVTILTNSTITVRAELQGSDGTLTQAESTLEGGSTGVLLIPPIEVAPVSQGLSYRLVLRGYEGTRLLFINDTTLKLSQNTPSTLVWTHRSNYRPNQTVKIQVQSVHSDGTPYRGRVDITVQDPTGNVRQQWRSLDCLQGIVTSELKLPHNPHFGMWVIQAVVDGRVSGRKFTVSLNGSKSNNVEGVAEATERHSIEFSPHPQLLKPSLTFSSKVKISTVDQRSVSSADRVNGVRVKVTQLRAPREEHEHSGARGRADIHRQGGGTAAEVATQTITYALPEDGRLPIQFHIQEEVEKIIIQVKFMSAEQTLVLSRTLLSPSGSYIQISPPSQLAQIAGPVQLNTESLYPVTEFHYVVTSRGQAVAAGRMTSSSPSLTPTQSWAPEACITAFQQLPSGEILIDTVYLPPFGENVLAVQLEYETGSPQAEYACNLVVLTNANLQQSGKRGAFNYVVGKSVTESHGEEKTPRMETGFSDTWIWMKTDMSDINASLHRLSSAPFSSRKDQAFVLWGDHQSGHVSRLKRAADDKSLTWSVLLPLSLIKGEELILEVQLLNHLQYDTEVMVAVEENEMFEFVLIGSGAVSTPNKQKLRVKALGRARALFPIRPLVVGEIPLSFYVMSSHIQNHTTVKLLVVPEGHQQTFSQSLFLDIPPTRNNLSVALQFTLPHGAVPQTQGAHVAVAGDILGPSIAGLASLIQMPDGCGEQNMIHFAPSVYVLQYLSGASRTNEDIAEKALAYMKEGYNRELSYLRDDGSFSGFGRSDPSGSTWLTAFVLRCFLQAQAFMQIDQSMLSTAFTWLADQQTPEGSFLEPGRVLHTQLQGGLDGPVSLTAYVLMTLSEDKAHMGLFPGNVSKAKEFLEMRLASGITSNYSLSLVAYALSLANSPSAQHAINELMSRADMKDGVAFWSSGDADLSESWQPPTAGIEMAAYALLSLFRQGSIVESIELMKWLSTQRGPSGGFGSTQDTVIALQALSYYAAFSGSEAIDLKFKLTSRTSPMVTSFTINSTNYLTPHQQQIDFDTSVHIDIFLEGRGFALFQMNIFYNLESLALSQTQRHSLSHEAFGLSVEVSDDETDMDHILLSICTKLSDSQSVERTGMAMLDVQILSGFMLRQSGVETDDLVKRVELLPGRAVLYLDSLGEAEKCVEIPLVRAFKVAHVQPALIQVFDYYEPRRRAVRLYHSKLMRDFTVCGFCGDSCSQCWDKTTTSDTTTIHPRNSAIYSLGCLLLFVLRIWL